ncbi:MAG: hypothetical protein IJQ32_00290 [Paludibacteraceae bacterium]|nr:hypothetical protein [Paludibacteraceae bacterium]
MAQSKIELILEMKERIRTNLTKAKDAVSQSTKDMQDKLNHLKGTFVNAFAEMRKEIPIFDKAIRLLKNPISLVVGAFGALRAGIGKLNEFAAQSRELYNAQAEAETKLAAVMRNTMGARTSEINSIKALASEQQRLGVIGDEVQLAGAQELGTYLTKADNLKKLMPVMNDMVAQQYGLNATQEQATSIATMMGKVMDGQVGALSRYGYKFDEAQEKILKFGTEEQRAATLADVVSTSVGGVNAALAQTPEGALKQYENNLGDLQERFGGLFTAIAAAWLPVRNAIMSGWERVVSVFERNKERITATVTAVANVIGAAIRGVFTALGWIKNAFAFIYEWREVIYGVIGAFALLNAKLIATTAVTAALAVKNAVLTAAQWLLNVAMSANPIGIIIVAIGALIGAIIALCRRYEGWTSVWNAVKTTLVLSFKQYVENWKFGIKELWMDLQIFWERIKSFGSNVGNVFKALAQAMKAVLKGDFDGAKAALANGFTFTANANVTALEQQRDTNRQTFKDESMARAKEIAEAWKQVDLHKKQDTEPATAQEEQAIYGAGGAPSGESGAPITGSEGSSGIGTAESVAGSAKQIRNITVNIDAFNKGGINTTNTEGLRGMDSSQIEDWFNQMLLRAIRNLEMSY